MLNSDTNGNPETESDDNSFKFLKSLQELKELRAQIHHAANYCEKSFLNTENKSAVLDNTKEYLCRAVVTVVDHLGSVSTNLNQRIQKSDIFFEAQIRINCLKQKLDLCDQFNQSFTLTKIPRKIDLPRFHPHYISSPSESANNESSLKPREPNKAIEPTSRIISSSNKELKTNDEDMHLFMYTSSKKIYLDIFPRGISVMPVVHEEFSVAPKLIRNPSFHLQESRKVSRFRRILRRKSMDEDEISSNPKRSTKKEWPSRLLLKLKS